MNNNKDKLAKFIQDTVPVPLQAVEEIIAQFEEVVIAKNDFFLKAGAYSNTYLFLNNGFLRAFTHNQDGDEVTTGFYSSSSVVFEVYSFFNRTVSSENIQALTECSGLVISFDKLNHLFHSMPAFRDFGRAVLVRGFSRLKQRMLSMINETAEERYAALMKTNPEVFQYAPLKDIASYLGVTDTSLSRIRKNFIHK
jgi:CRP-like cAMP-binding protein